MTESTVWPWIDSIAVRAASAPGIQRYCDLLMASFVTVLICSEFILVTKVARLGTFEFGAGWSSFP
jgi:hypothetical protein